MDFVQGMLPASLNRLFGLGPATDSLSEYVTLFHRFLPPSIASPIISIIAGAFGILKTAQTHLSPLLSRIISQPDVASILALLAILFISLKILDMAYRAVIFWVNLVIRLVLWGGVLILGFWVWNRGVDGFVEDVQGLAQHWTGQYEKFAGEAKAWKKAEEAQIKFNARQQQGGWGGRGW